MAAPRPPSRVTQLVQELAGLPQIAGIESFGELIVHLTENPARFGRCVSVVQQPCEIKRRTELPGKHAYLVSHIE